MSSEPTPAASGPVPAPDSAPTASKRPWWRSPVFIAIVAVIVFDIVIVFLVPPVPREPGPCEFPSCGVTALLEPIAPHTVFTLVPGSDTFTISATILTTWIVMAIVLLALLVVTRRLDSVPRGSQNLIEWVIESMAAFATSFGGPEARRYVPLFLGLFLFILVSNWIGLVPIVGRVEFLRAPTSDINVTFGLALVSFVTFHYEGVRVLGFRGYLGKFFNFSGFRRSAFDGFVDLFVGVIEFFLEFFKPLTLALRLFANVYGGELVLGVFTALFIAIIPIAFLGLELFVGFMQALVFATLTMVFTLIAIESHHEEEGGHAPANAPDVHAPVAAAAH